MTTTIKLLKKKKLKNPVLITGLPGIGLVGKLVVDYMLKESKAERIAEVHSDSFPPAVHTHNSLLSLIRDDFFYLRAKNRDFIFLAGPVQPALDMRYATTAEHYEFAEKIADFAAGLGVKEIYTLAGINIGDARITREPHVVVCGTDRKTVDAFVKLGCVASTSDGLISGAAGLILGVGATRGITGACLMGETNANLVYGDHGSAKVVLELLSKKFGFSVKMQQIEKESKNIEKAFNQLNQELQAQQKEAADDDAPPHGLTYVR
jgi:uncharacterized protein (TIGR00162 family)